MSDNITSENAIYSSWCQQKKNYTLILIFTGELGLAPRTVRLPTGTLILCGTAGPSVKQLHEAGWHFPIKCIYSQTHRMPFQLSPNK